MRKLLKTLLAIAILFLASGKQLSAQELIPVEKGWSQTSVNTVVFRKNSLSTYRDTQYVSYYNPEGYVILAKRELNSPKWEIHKTQYQGRVEDAHNSISIMVDGKGYLHVGWNHHGDSLNYAMSKSPGGLELTEELPMTGAEENVTYPEFFKMPNGNLLFFYRSGASGRGNLVINKYDNQTGKWTRLHDVLISGEGERNAYWQAFVNGRGSIHISWVWRETWDVATNHDLCYARSEDGGKTWQNSKGETYDLPITHSTAEVVAGIPQGSELINQASMYADGNGHPYIATYWKEKGDAAPQFRLVYHDGTGWNQTRVGDRELDFSLSGGGTKKIPVSRPQVVVNESENPTAYVIYRDAERGNKASVSYSKIPDDGIFNWKTIDLTETNLGSWEPTYDTEAWKTRGELHLLIQKVGQGDGERLEDIEPQMIQVLEWKPAE